MKFENLDLGVSLSSSRAEKVEQHSQTIEVKEEKDKVLLDKIDKLELQLRIPKLHRDFLEGKGTLDFFTKAVLQGKDEAAKWTLLKSG